MQWCESFLLVDSTDTKILAALTSTGMALTWADLGVFIFICV